MSAKRRFLEFQSNSVDEFGEPVSSGRGDLIILDDDPSQKAAKILEIPTTNLLVRSSNSRDPRPETMVVAGYGIKDGEIIPFPNKESAIGKTAEINKLAEKIRSGKQSV